MSLELGKIPRILEWLVRQGVISEESQAEVVETAKAKKGFFGDIAVSMGVPNLRTGKALN